MANLVTFFGEGKDGRKLVGIGITEEMIQELRRNGGALEEAERTGQGVDVMLVYSPELNGLVKKLKRYFGSKGEFITKVL